MVDGSLEWDECPGGTHAWTFSAGYLREVSVRVHISSSAMGCLLSRRYSVPHYVEVGAHGHLCTELDRFLSSGLFYALYPLWTPTVQLHLV